MTAIHLQARKGHAGHPPHQAALDALSDLAYRAAGILRQWRRRIREREQLARMDDRMLADIGMTHADREVLVSKPFWRE